MNSLQAKLWQRICCDELQTHSGYSVCSHMAQDQCLLLSVLAKGKGETSDPWWGQLFLCQLRTVRHRHQIWDLLSIWMVRKDRNTLICSNLTCESSSMTPWLTLNSFFHERSSSSLSVEWLCLIWEIQESLQLCEVLAVRRPFTLFHTTLFQVSLAFWSELLGSSKVVACSYSHPSLQPQFQLWAFAPQVVALKVCRGQY